VYCDYLHVKCLFSLSDFNLNWNVSTNFIETARYQMSSKSAQRFSSCYRRTDRHEEAARHIFLNPLLIFLDTVKLFPVYSFTSFTRTSDSGMVAGSARNLSSLNLFLSKT
jgi:hypothetical protein